MQSVALFLQIEANKRNGGENHSPEDFDLFGRSSFNRYYYTLFLEIRKMLSELDSKWKKPQHAHVPAMLRGCVLNGIEHRRKLASKFGDEEAVKLCSIAKLSLEDLAQIMSSASAVRVVADYNPEIPVYADDNGSFQLANTSVETAHNWLFQAKIHIQNVKIAWKISDE